VAAHVREARAQWLVLLFGEYFTNGARRLNLARLARGEETIGTGKRSGGTAGAIRYQQEHDPDPERGGRRARARPQATATRNQQYFAPFGVRTVDPPGSPEMGCDRMIIVPNPGVVPRAALL
jgi:hypothetical protein